MGTGLDSSLPVHSSTSKMNARRCLLPQTMSETHAQCTLFTKQMKTMKTIKTIPENHSYLHENHENHTFLLKNTLYAFLIKRYGFRGFDGFHVNTMVFRNGFHGFHGFHLFCKYCALSMSLGHCLRNKQKKPRRRREAAWGKASTQPPAPGGAFFCFAQAAPLVHLGGWTVNRQWKIETGVCEKKAPGQSDADPAPHIAMLRVHHAEDHIFVHSQFSQH